MMIRFYWVNILQKLQLDVLIKLQLESEDMEKVGQIKYLTRILSNLDVISNNNSKFPFKMQLETA